MSEPERLLRVTPSLALKQKRLSLLLGGEDPSSPRLREAIEDAQLLGSLELSGLGATWEEVKASRHALPAEGPLAGMRRAAAAVDPRAPFTTRQLLTWHAAATGSDAGWRRGERHREGTPASPPAFIAGRLEILEQWLAAESSAQMKPAQRGALVLARIVEILPFDDANGRVSRLAASHVMVRSGAHPPILVGADRVRLEQCLQAAFQFATQPLVALLEEASERALDVMIQTLEQSQ